ncbi:MAG: hypothetical protein ABI670_04835 [Chloroflexota bacterium]
MAIRSTFITAFAVLCLLGGLSAPLQSAAAGSMNEEQVAYLRGDISNFAWSPDGKQITIETNSGGSSDIYTMNADGTKIRPIAGNAQMVDDLLAAGALAACIAIGSGLFVVARKRRKDGDGL